MPPDDRGAARGRRGRIDGCSPGRPPASGCARARYWCSPGGRTPASRRSSTHCSAPNARWSPRCRARRATRSRPTPISSAGRCGSWTPPGSGIGRPDRPARRRSEPALSGCSGSRGALRGEPDGRSGADERRSSAERPTLLVRTKADLVADCGRAAVSPSPLSPARARRAAARRGERVFGDRIALADLEPALTRERHRTALARARAALADALAASRRGTATRCSAAHHVREATTALDELLGAVDIEEVLDRVFASVLRRKVAAAPALYAVWIPRATSSAGWKSGGRRPNRVRPARARPPAPRSSDSPGSSRRAREAPGRPPAAPRDSCRPRDSGAGARARSARGRARRRGGGTPPFRAAGGTGGGDSRSSRPHRSPGATAWAACTASPSFTSSSRSVARLPVDQ